MTLAIAVCIPDGAILMADGLRKNILTGEVVSSKINKISVLSKSVGAIRLGVEKGTDHALLMLNNTILDSAQSCQEIVDEIDRATRLGWEHLKNISEGLIDPDHECNKVALVFGGYVSTTNQGGFIGSALYHSKGHHTPTPTTTISFSVTGGEKYDAKSRFDELVSTELGKSHTSEGGVKNDVVIAILNAGRMLISEISKKDPFVGGIPRYTIIRRGFRALEGEL